MGKDPGFGPFELEYPPPNVRPSKRAPSGDPE
jgi:hypothetical protein